MRNFTRCAALALLLLLMLAPACGDDDDDASDATGDTGGTTETTVASGGEDACAASSDDSDLFGPQFVIAELAFNPDTFTVGSGDVFSVANEDGTMHTVTSDEGGFDCELPGGESATILVDAAPGEYEFHCKIHPSMTGTMTVD